MDDKVTSRTWVIVMNQSSARLCEYSKHTQQLMTLREFQFGALKQDIENEKLNRSKITEQLNELVDKLKSANQKGVFGKLIVVAPKTMLDLFRDLVNDAKACEINDYITLDLVALDDSDLREKMKEHLADGPSKSDSRYY